MAAKQIHLDSLRRNQKYKEILEHGTNATEESEGRSIVKNLNIVKGLFIDSNKLIQVADRIGYTNEVRKLMDKVRR